MDDRTLRTAIAAADGDDPYRALRELRHARVELNLALDRAEAVAVRRARATGSSWQLIALALECPSKRCTRSTDGASEHATPPSRATYAAMRRGAASQRMRHPLTARTRKNT